MAEKSASPPVGNGKGLSLYANLLPGANSANTISSAPVVYKRPDGSEDSSSPAEAAKQKINAGLEHF